MRNVREFAALLDLTGVKRNFMSWRLPETVLFGALIVCMAEHLMVRFSFRSYFLQGVILYRKAFLVPNVDAPFPTSERLKNDFEKLRLSLVVKDLGGGLFGIHGSHGPFIVSLFDLLHGSLRFQPTTKTITLTGRSYWSHVIFIFLGLTVAFQYKNPVILIVLSVAYLVRYFFHLRKYSMVGKVAVSAWSECG